MSLHRRRAFVLRTAASFLLITVNAAVVSGCTRESRSAPAGTEHSIELTVQPNPASVGPSHLLIEVFSPEGEPIEGAEVSARGEMDHAGMVAVFGEAEQIEPGRYRVRFEWTMAGDWIVTVTAELPSGTHLERSFDIRVGTERG